MIDPMKEGNGFKDYENTISLSGKPEEKVQKLLKNSPTEKKTEEGKANYWSYGLNHWNTKLNPVRKFNHSR